MWQSMTFTAASANLDNFVALDTGPGDATHQDGSPQCARIFAQTTNSDDEHTLTFVLVRGNQVFAEFDVTITATSRRMAADNGSGLYVCECVVAETGTSKIDLLGDWYQNRQKGRGVGGVLDGAIWMVGCKAIQAETTLNVQIAPSSVA